MKFCHKKMKFLIVFLIVYFFIRTIYIVENHFFINEIRWFLIAFFYYFSKMNLKVKLEYIIFLVIFMAITYIDYYKKIIPDFLLMILILNSIFIQKITFLDSILKSVFLFFLFTLFYLLSYFILQKECFGFGDVKLLSVLGLYFSVIEVFFILYLASIIGICIILLKRIILGSKINKIAFAPCIFLSSWLMINYTYLHYFFNICIY